MIDRVIGWMDQGESYYLLNSVRDKVGYSRDVELSEDIFMQCDRLEKSNRTYVNKLYKGAVVYRDDKPTTSLHVTDFRESEIDGIGAHLEYFNPEYHPLLHLIDVALWHIKNTLKDQEKARIEN